MSFARARTSDGKFAIERSVAPPTGLPSFAALRDDIVRCDVTDATWDELVAAFDSTRDAGFIREDADFEAWRLTAEENLDATKVAGARSRMGDRAFLLFAWDEGLAADDVDAGLDAVLAAPDGSNSMALLDAGMTRARRNAAGLDYVLCEIDPTRIELKTAA